MSQGGRPEDERLDEGEELEVGPDVREPEGLGLFDDEPEEPQVVEEPDRAAETVAAPAGAPQVEGPPTEPPSPVDSGDERPPGRRALRALVVVGGLLAVALLMVGWNRVASSSSFCGSCHEMKPSIASAQRSVHASLSCLACHTGPGLTGALRYLPSLGRETIHKFTGWDIADGILTARSCESCHDDIASTPALAAAHTEGAKCATCHGDVAHPPFRLAGFARPADTADGSVHPRLYVQTHSSDAVRDPTSCTGCHATDYCETCHLRETYPHPADWIAAHGSTQEEVGIDACDGCHAQTFCIGCHGTEIPHNVRWLGEHWRTLGDATTVPCMLCHPKTDCTQCHARHAVHREQDLFA